MSAVSKDTSSKPTRTTGPTELRIAHFNDVYQVADHLVTRDNGTQDNVNAAKFATLLKGVTGKWPGGKTEGLILFSGDLFSPSLASSITEGWHTVSVINELKVDVAVVGNHEFDFGYPHLSKLVKDTAFPWLLSNIIDTETKEVPYPLKKFHVEERHGIRIGFIGLVQKEWVDTIVGWPANFEYQPMATVGKELSALLRDPAGQIKCDLVIALTHSHTSNDITLARELFALSPSAQANTDITSEHGVDLLLGGHDHYYWVSKGVTSWDGYNVQQEMEGATSDEGDVLVVKSGTDFGDLSEVILTLKDTPEGSIRKKVIESIKGVRHFTRGNTEVDEHMQKVVDFEFPDILKALNKPILKTAVELDVRSEYIRSQESPIGNWVADSIRNAYDEVLVKLVGKGADGVIATAGELRGNASFKNPPVVLTLLDLKRILHYDNPVVALELEGKTLWAAMESGLSKWPDTAGRFPAISGFHVSWDGSRPANQRVLEIWFQEESTEHGRPKVIKKQVTRTSDTKYVILVGEYLANGGDGYAVLKDQKVIIDEENGKSKFLLIKKFLKGAQALVTMVQTEATSSKFLHSETVNLVSAAKARSGFQSSTLTFDLPSTFIPTLAWPASRELYTSALKIAEREDLSFLDPYEWFRAHRQPPSTVGAIATGLVTMSLETAIATVTAQDPAAHKGDEVKAKEGKKEVKVLPTIHPVVDDRLKNAAPARSRDAADDSAER